MYLMRNFDDTDLMGLALLLLAGWVFWLGHTEMAMAIIGPVIGFYFGQKQAVKMGNQMKDVANGKNSHE